MVLDARRINLGDPRIERGVRDALLAAIRAGHDEGADVFAGQVLDQARSVGIANGAQVGDVLLAGAQMIETRAALDRRAALSEDLVADRELVTVCAADVQMRPVEWLWPSRIARGKVTLIAGDPGLGKTQIVMSIAAIVTAGLTWPLSAVRCDPGDVLLLSAEDDPEDTLVPRAKAAGADLTRLHIVRAVRDIDREGRARRRAANLADDLALIELRLAALRRPTLVIVDPVSAYLGRADSHNNAEVRALLAPVAELAARHRVAIVCVSHLNKASGPKALQRVVGSIAFTAAARAAYLVARESDDSPRRVIVPLKNNLGVDRGGYSFDIEEVDLGESIHTSRVRWSDSAVDVTADELLLAEAKPAAGSALDDACNFLARALGHGEVASKQIEQQAAHEGLSWRTVDRAAKALSVHKRKEHGKGGRWLWSLSDQAPLA